VPTATLTSKGQTTIPKEVREYLGLRAGDRIDFLLVDGRAILQSVNLDVRSLKGFLHKPGRTPVTVEEMSVRHSKLSRKEQKTSMSRRSIP
jgi:antitoxin PrlF